MYVTLFDKCVVYSTVSLTKHELLWIIHTCEIHGWLVRLTVVVKLEHMDSRMCRDLSTVLIQANKFAICGVLKPWLQHGSICTSILGSGVSWDSLRKSNPCYTNEESVIFTLSLRELLRLLRESFENLNYFNPWKVLINFYVFDLK